MRHTVELARRAGESDAKVLITGESGVGKDVLARETHACSNRRNRPYIAVNCAGFPETLLESELFGHARGSFTGADRDRVGKIQMADRGTLFLDEVGEMSLRMQAALLPIGISASVSRPGTFAKTSSIGFASSRSRFRRCAIDATTSRL
jgi:transcriptional regulator with PAS, ATPase and Fis domain